MLTISFARNATMPDDELTRLVGDYGFTIANLSHRLSEAGAISEYRMVIRSRHRSNAERLSKHLRGLEDVLEFRIAPTED